MAIYKLTSYGVFRTTDGANIPDHTDNIDWQAYQAWIAVGNTADPADTPPSIVQMPTPREWLERLPIEKQLAIIQAGQSNAQIQLWLMKASGTTAIDVTLQETIDGIGALVQAGILTTDEQATMLAP